MSTRWQNTEAPRGDDYDARWRSLAASGQSVHGEADLVEAILGESGGTRVLDAGCGTGRVAIELSARGFSVVGVDADPGMLTTARAKSPELPWIDADLADLPESVGAGFDLALLAGNVMIFLQPGTEAAVVTAIGERLVPGGLLVSGFSIRPDRLSLKRYDELTQRVGLEPVARWATWNREPFTGGDYAVSVHRRLEP
ncbi:class I SAM-dependent methyltransferase [Mycobacterium sp. URHB0044]|uniref:class I SAM-dependent DNA methyltransferase n=1 Tax=Mycobacterium sp. URHB0044 TaxID=1380386 RepID=UPI00048F45FE|nr:class I SAM-dependent methyltransferase [Mycobacterium sp. URHB0044]